MAETRVDQQKVLTAFQRTYGLPPALVARAPGRVNLIGGHTDYNQGYVLPAAIDRWTYFALAPAERREIRCRSAQFTGELVVGLDDLQGEAPPWSEYVRGVLWVLRQQGHALRPWRGLLMGDVPLGAGLSSSASLELALLRGLAAWLDLPWEPQAMARLGQRAERQWVGVQCGIMDQLAAACGRERHALLIDCRSLELEPIPLPAQIALVVLDTGTRRSLADSAYNRRREECAQAAEICGLQSLRDLTPERLGAMQRELGPALYRRARHVVSENQRVLAAAQALRRGDMAAVGALLLESHASLAEDYQVSSAALDAMVEIARQAPGCLGARMTGAGFGGCALALVSSEQVPAFSDDVRRVYAGRTGHKPRIYACRAVAGAELVWQGG